MKLIASLLAVPAFAAALATSALAGNLETVQGIYAAFGKGDVPAILDQLADDVTWDQGHDGEANPFLAPRAGKAGVGEFFAALQGLEFRKFAVLNMLEGPNQIAVLVDLDLVVKATGKPFVEQEIHLWTFGADGKVASFRHFVDTLEYAAAVK